MDLTSFDKTSTRGPVRSGDGAHVRAHPPLLFVDSGARHPDQAELEKDAFTFAAQGNPAKIKNLAALHVDPAALATGERYAVDVARRTLVPAPKR